MSCFCFENVLWSRCRTRRRLPPAAVLFPGACDRGTTALLDAGLDRVPRETGWSGTPGKRCSWKDVQKKTCSLALLPDANFLKRIIADRKYRESLLSRCEHSPGRWRLARAPIRVG